MPDDLYRLEEFLEIAAEDPVGVAYETDIHALLPRKVFFPCPCRSKGLVDAPLSLPAKLLVCKRRIRPECVVFTRLAGSEFPIQLHAVALRERIDQLKHGNRVPCTDIENLIVFFHPAFEHPRNSADMGLGEVDNVNIVALACPVLCRVIVAEHRKALAPADGGLRNKRHKVIRHPARQLSDQGGWMRADGVEISQCNALDAAV